MDAFLQTILGLFSGVAPTKEQLVSLVSTIVKSVGLVLIQKGIVSSENWSFLSGDGAIAFYVGVITMLAPIIHDMIIHSLSGKTASAKTLPPAEKIQVAETLPDGAKLRMVEAMPDVKSIVAKPTASDGVAAAVNDSSRPKVVSAPMAA